MKSTSTFFYIIYFLTFTLLLVSPLPYGGVTPGGRLLIQLICYCLFFIYLLSEYKKYELHLPSLRKNHAVLALILFILVCLLQIIPLPGFLLGILSPGSYEIWSNSQDLLNEIGLAGKSMFNTISIDPHRTWKETVTVLSYIAFGYVISRAFTSERKLRLLLIPLFILAVFESSYGIYQYIIDVGETNPFNKNVATGTYVNRNNFAGLLEMTIPLILGYTFSLVSWKPHRSLLSNFSSSDNFSKQILFIFILGIMVLSLIFSLSRMGIVAIFLSLLFFFLVYSNISKQSKRNTFFLIIFLCAIILLFALAIGVYPAFERFLAIKDGTPNRVLVWNDMLSAVKDFPVFGSGLDTFRYIYLYYNRVIEDPIEFRYAHNDYLQLLIETGFIGALSLLTALFLFIRSCWGNLIRLHGNGDLFRFFIGLGALTGIVGILIHSFVEFNLHIPANAAYFALLMGILAAVGRADPEDRQSRGKIHDLSAQDNLTKWKRRKKLSGSAEDENQ